MKEVKKCCRRRLPSEEGTSLKEAKNSSTLRCDRVRTRRSALMEVWNYGRNIVVITSVLRFRSITLSLVETLDQQEGSNTGGKSSKEAKKTFIYSFNALSHASWLRWELGQIRVNFGLFKLNDLVPAHTAPERFPASWTPEIPPAKALFSNSSRSGCSFLLWYSLTSPLFCSSPYVARHRLRSPTVTGRHRRSPDVADNHRTSLTVIALLTGESSSSDR
ncbi:hypothetical protein MA16_Dca013477 [Dendrobium catenatum]|uniref:Uncharacterized protein n=1 Tax=Dendrobium catenatum TaxID=906689 RepID=A0A2I0W452_9ASPA|nr:hypothetical protein MA16_Dca013477 [Dendrobium catenatum]